MKILFLFIVAALLLFPKETQNQVVADPYKLEWERFCKVWMSYVNKYPKAMHAGCCEIDHPSNDILKEGWEGESLLLCDYCDGEFCYG
jgi:hypothetical protein